MAALRAALILNPQNQTANRNLAAMLVQRIHYDEALPYARRAVELSPNHALAHDLLGVVLTFQSKPTEAFAEFEQAVQLNPRDPSILEHYQATAQERQRRGAVASR